MTPTCWIVEFWHDGKMVSNEVTFIPSYADKCREAGYVVVPLYTDEEITKKKEQA